MTRALPPSASIASSGTGVKLHAPSAERNADVLAAFVSAHAPKCGTALEIASGTGQHITAFGAALPALQWQPTEIDQDRQRSIDAYVAEANIKNVANASFLNATAAGWSKEHAPKDLIVLINLLHLISAPETQTLITEAALTLAPNGTLILYGPFARDGQLTSDGDMRFDTELRAADPAIGYKDTRDMQHWLGHAGLTEVTAHNMPANNLAFVARKPKP